MKIKKKVMVLFGFLSFATAVTIGTNVKPVEAYTINNEYNIGSNAGSPFRAQNKYIILHETANPTATGRNEASYMSRNWFNAYTTYIVGDGGIVYKIKEPGYISYGAGNGNVYAPVQIELQHTSNPTLFKQNYKAYIDLARDSAKQFGIPLNLDPTFGEKGIVSHQYISTYIWGDHQDPYGYLASMGISKAQLAHDLKYGVDGVSTGNQGTVSTPSPSQSSIVGKKVNQGIYQVDDLAKVNGIWQVRTNALAPVDFTWTDNGIGVGDIVLTDKNGVILADQTTRKGSYYVFNTNNIQSVGNTVYTIGGYKWLDFNLQNSGHIWLAATSKSNLINKKLQGTSAPSNHGTKINQGVYRVDAIQYVNGIWQVKNNWLVPVNFNWTDNGIDVADIHMVDKNGYLKANQNSINTGDYFVFDTNYVYSVSTPVLGDGGYLWAKTNFKNGGKVWLSVYNKNDLINKTGTK